MKESMHRTSNKWWKVLARIQNLWIGEKNSIWTCLKCRAFPKQLSE